MSNIKALISKEKIEKRTDEIAKEIYEEYKWLKEVDSCILRTTIDDLAGPVGITAIVTQTSSITDFVYLLSVISLSLGITNFMPIPPLDRWKTFNIYNRVDKEKTT